MAERMNIKGTTLNTNNNITDAEGYAIPPLASNLGLGQLAVHTSETDPCLFFKTTAGKMVKIVSEEKLTKVLTDILGNSAADLDTLRELIAQFEGSANDILPMLVALTDRVTSAENTLGTKANSSVVNAHINNTSNPHGVTASQVGLGNVRNVEQLGKNETAYDSDRLGSKLASHYINKTAQYLNNFDACVPLSVTTYAQGPDNHDLDGDLSNVTVEGHMLTIGNPVAKGQLAFQLVVPTSMAHGLYYGSWYNDQTGRRDFTKVWDTKNANRSDVDWTANNLWLNEIYSRGAHFGSVNASSRVLTIGTTDVKSGNDIKGINFEANGSIRATLLANGNWGFGTNNPTERLDVDGNGKFKGAVTASGDVVAKANKAVVFTANDGAGGAQNLYQLLDVEIPTPANGQSLIYNSTSNKWINKLLSKEDVGLSNVRNVEQLGKDENAVSATNANYQSVIRVENLIGKTVLDAKNALRDTIKANADKGTIVINLDSVTGDLISNWYTDNHVLGPGCTFYYAEITNAIISDNRTYAFIRFTTYGDKTLYTTSIVNDSWQPMRKVMYLDDTAADSNKLGGIVAANYVYGNNNIGITQVTTSKDLDSINRGSFFWRQYADTNTDFGSFCSGFHTEYEDNTYSSQLALLHNTNEIKVRFKKINKWEAPFNLWTEKNSNLSTVDWTANNLNLTGGVYKISDTEQWLYQVQRSDATAVRGILSDGFNLQFATNNASRLTILSGGNIGVRKPNPTEALDVNGNILANKVKIVSSATEGIIQLGEKTDGTAQGVISAFNATNLAKLAVLAQLTDFAGSGLFKGSVTAKGDIVSKSPNAVVFTANDSTSGASRLIDLIDVHIPQGITAKQVLAYDPTIKNSDGTSGGYTFMSSAGTGSGVIEAAEIKSLPDHNHNDIVYASDERLKENVIPLRNATIMLNNLRPKEYNWNETGKSLGLRDPKAYGLIAQEVEGLREIIDLVKPLHGGESGYLGVDYVKLVPVIVAGFQEQHKEIVNLNSTLKAIKARANKSFGMEDANAKKITALEEEVAELKRLMAN